MTTYAPVTITDTTTVAGGGAHAFGFRPEHEGVISVVSTPAHRPSTSETGELGFLRLYRPPTHLVAPVPPTSAPLTATRLTLGYTATAADLTAAGNWMCQVHNATDQALEFSTTITYPSNTVMERRSATFDVGLLNLMLAEAVADARLAFHIESSGSDGQDASTVSLSSAAAGLLKPPYQGLETVRFRVPDYRDEGNHDVIGDVTWAVIRFSFDSDPVAPVQVFVTNESGEPALWVSLSLVNGRATIVDSDVGADALHIGLDGDAKIAVECDFHGAGLSATVQGDFELTMAGSGVYNAALSVDFTGNVASPVRQVVGEALDTLFVKLMRLGHGATALGYTSDDVTLTVDYWGPIH